MRAGNALPGAIADPDHQSYGEDEMAPSKMPEQSYLVECFDYDPSTGVLTWRERPEHHFPCAKSRRLWNAANAGKAVGYVNEASCNWTHMKTSINNRKFYLHRVIWKMVTGEEPRTVDHINGDASDNRFQNLRAATIGENSRNNRGRRVRKHPLPKGVIPNKSRYSASIVANGVLHLLGTFDTPSEAHEAYCRAADLYHGDFANHGHG